MTFGAISRPASNWRGITFTTLTGAAAGGGGGGGGGGGATRKLVSCVLGRESVKINGITNTDAGSVSVRVTAVRQDEPTNTSGDGNTPVDASVSGGNVSVRAERMGGGNGRVYEIAFTATNAGGACSGTVRVGVPHDQGKPAIQDSKVRYDSLTGQKI